MPVTILVPGYGGRFGVVERWRMGVASKTLSDHGGGRLVLSGHRGEAERLAALAPPHAEISIESSARSTFENIEKSLPLLAGTAQLVIATDRFHRRRAVRYLRELDPEMAARVVDPDYGWRTGWWMDSAGALYEALVRAQRALLGRQR
ncbi:MAG: YdcF family protein [Actinobacteria bacterium]|nr:YdcF family protein [Actinomycetota bacterium]